MKNILPLILIFCTGNLVAQNHPTYVQSIDGIVEMLYGSISGDAGVERKWEEFRSLFAENGQLIPTGRNQEGKVGFQSWTPEEYIERANGWLVNNGFHEVEINRVTETFGPVTHIFSTYESRNKADDAKPFARGINSIQLFNDGERWWIMTIYWWAETEDTPIPARYLPG